MVVRKAVAQVHLEDAVEKAGEPKGQGLPVKDEDGRSFCMWALIQMKMRLIQTDLIRQSR